MAVTIDNTNKPLIPRGDDQSPKGYNRAELYTGKALDFDGVNDEVDLGTGILTGTGDFTYCGYVKSDGTQNIGTIFANYPAGNLQVIYGKRFIGLWLGNNSTYLGTSPWNVDLEEFTTDWVFLTALREGTETRFYMNGVLMKTGSSSSTIGDSSDSFKLGTATNGNERFDGKIANSRAFNVALTEAQILDLYNNPEKVVPTGVADSALKLWLPMQEGAGTTAYDGSGNGNHGTISGATWTHGIGAPVSQTAVIDWNKTSNLVAYSEEFDNAYWTKQFITITANDTTSPDGQDTADKITPSASTDTHYLYSPYSFNNENTFSVFAKYNGYNIGLRPSGLGYGKAFVNFDLQNGTILGSGGTDYEDSSITSFGDGWYRISMTMDNAASHGINFYAVNGTTATELPSFTADGTSGFYLWGAQVNAGATLEPYVRTFTSNKTSPVLLPQGLTTGRDITGVNLFENVRKQGALNLDGNSWAEVHDNESLDITDAVSVEMWIYWEDQSAESTILGKWLSGDNRAYALIATTTTGEIDFRQRVSSSTYTLGISTLSSGWNHVVATHDHSANERIGYINGVQVSTSSSQGVSNESDNNITIGGISTAQYTNSIAQPRIYNRALTAEEVQTNYDKGKDIFTN